MDLEFMNPFEVPEVVENVLKFLDFPALTKSRFISSLWSLEGLKEMLRRKRSISIAIPSRLLTVQEGFDNDMLKQFHYSKSANGQGNPSGHVNELDNGPMDGLPAFISEYKSDPDNKIILEEIQRERRDGIGTLSEMLYRTGSNNSMRLVLKGVAQMEFFTDLFYYDENVEDLVSVLNCISSLVIDGMWAGSHLEITQDAIDHDLRFCKNVLRLLPLLPNLKGKLDISWSDLMVLMDQDMLHQVREEDGKSRNARPLARHELGKETPETVMEKLSQLNDIDLFGIMSPDEFPIFVETINNSKGNLDGISNFGIYDCNQEIFGLYVELGVRWRIKNLDLVVMPGTSVRTVRRFLESVSGTLTSLRIHFDGGLRNLDEPSRNLDDWLFPLSLHSLECLEIQEQSDVASSQKTHQVALKLPSLKSLMIPLHGLSPESRDKKHSSEFQCKTLHTLNIRVGRNTNKNPNSQESGENSNLDGKEGSRSIIDFTPYPNLKVLVINLYLSSKEQSWGILQEIFSLELNSICPDLERLELNLSGEPVTGSNPTGNLNNWGDFLMGRREDGGSATPNPVYSIHHLKSLKSLTIKMTTHTDFALTDTFLQFISNGMRNLQSLYFHGNLPFSVEAVEKLKTDFGPMFYFSHESS